MGKILEQTEGTQSLNKTMAGQKGQLVRGIGMFGGVLLVLNGMIGAGIFALPSAVAARAGILSLWLFLAAASISVISASFSCNTHLSVSDCSSGPYQASRLS